MDKKFHYKLDDIESINDGSNSNIFWLHEVRGGQSLFLQGEILDILHLSNVQKIMGTIALGGSFTANIVDGYDSARFTHKLQQGTDFVDDPDHGPFDTAARLRGISYFDNRLKND
jgi:hypothetical protein